MSEELRVKSKELRVKSEEKGAVRIITGKLDFYLSLKNFNLCKTLPGAGLNWPSGKDTSSLTPHSLTPLLQDTSYNHPPSTYPIISYL